MHKVAKMVITILATLCIKGLTFGAQLLQRDPRDAQLHAHRAVYSRDDSG